MTKTAGAEPRRHRARRAAAAVVARVRKSWPAALLVAVLLAVAIPSALLVVPGFLAPDQPAPAPAAPAWQQVPATLSAVPALAPLSAAAAIPRPAAVAAQLDPLLAADGGGNFTGQVQDALTGEVLFDRGGADARVPASNLKLLTAVAALRTLGPDHRFSTKVLAGPDNRQVVLTGGGDVLLGAGASDRDGVRGHAGLATLAARTADSLRSAGVTGEVTVGFDDSLFSGPALNPAWGLGDVAAGEVAPLAPLALNAARYDPAVTTGPRPQDPAAAAAAEFAGQLRAAVEPAGLTVAAAVERAPAPAGTGTGTGTVGEAGQEVLAAADSATVAEQVGAMLQDSDNYLAEALGRLAALASGRPGSNDGATAVVGAEAVAAGIAPAPLQLADVSGLAMGNQVPAGTFVRAVTAITSGPDDRLRAALAGFPVAGVSGTLDSRFGDDATARGAGLVRAKTGTLNTVIALSGYVVDADGRLLVFSFIGNGLTPGAAGNRAALDRAATALAACGCR
ncbi:D-alanyl-D-alanine carboxypeptidase/D-alanyl-D-alanine-endopeptidase [Arthrobacter sp. ZBG10]|uniref:D-alanyl-D-alanine carboxypeptidase/D-alanyl-D-alanine-endopeptidase n=1 Tax=Arthrobacter sp. ZBG10 TaxID=1676590 RepID=UPI0009E242E7|nr:D-alanyl-D-alanine carboxypeptidase [Arthrobacter sp. ZBG10]